MNNTSRCFVSIDLPPQVKEYLGTLAKPNIYWIKWMRPGNFHITLNFLGDLKPDRVEETRSVLTEVGTQFHSFQITLERIETERDMLWLMPNENADLENLQDELKTRLKSARLGKRERRSYVPHILLAKSKTGRNMRPVIENFQPQTFMVDRINLYESELTPGAATHRLIESFQLQ